MRSLYVRILLASFGTLLLSLAAFLGVFFSVTAPALDQAFRGFQAVQADAAADAFVRGGAPALSAYLSRLDRMLQSTHHLTDAAGKDVVTGDDRSALLRALDGRGGRPGQIDGRLVAIQGTEDGRYKLILVLSPRFGLRDFLPYYALILAAVAFVCWLLAVGIASPIRQVASVVSLFGRGQLGSRTEIRRRDEIGELANAFNEMAERIEKLVTAERRLLQDVSHELRSPLTRLNIGIELLRTAPDRNAAADRLQREADRLTRLVGALLEMTRLEGDPGSRPAASVDVGQLVREVVEDCGVEARIRGCSLALSQTVDRKTSGDGELLRRAFENVVRNAIRYAPDGTAIDVSLDASGDDTLIRVRDRGPGVPEDAVSALGTPFFRIDPSRDAGTGGVGLGLAIARRAIHLHHGTWKTENADPGLQVTMTVPSAVDA